MIDFGKRMNVFILICFTYFPHSVVPYYQYPSVYWAPKNCRYIFLPLSVDMHVLFLSNCAVCFVDICICFPAQHINTKSLKIVIMQLRQTLKIHHLKFNTNKRRYFGEGLIIEITSTGCLKKKVIQL